MKHVMGVILGGGKGTRLFPLTRERSKPAVPFGGNFRIVDIPISNCINSGINRVFVMTQFNSASLNTHIAQTYKFDIFHNGFVDILAAEQTIDESGGFSQGTADAVRRALKNITGYRDVKYLLVLGGDQLYRMDYRWLFRSHIERGDDITIGVIRVGEADLPRFGIMKMDTAGSITGFREKPQSENEIPGWRIPGEKEKPFYGSMGIYLFRFDIIADALRSQKQMDDFGKEVIPYCLGKHKVGGFEHQGYWEDIGTIRTYHEANLELTRDIPSFNLYDPEFPYFSRPRFLPPAKIVDARLKNCIASDGAIFERCSVRDSVIGIRSIVRDRAEIERSIVMGANYYETDAERDAYAKRGIPAVGIGPGTVIRNAIVDMNCRIGRDVRIVNTAGVTDCETENYSIIDGITVIPKNTVIPDGTEI
ncbi:MAG: glucose-1-phosphate adenylyltransferase [Spirochaetes bacterium GWF1_51_8]|nr:MAG: glucose-1-phosphate adenylyltransferase [Spirochaetes bacterium GWF1_51_8]